MQPASRCEFREQRERQNFGRSKSFSSSGHGTIPVRIEQPKWRLFGSESEERSFRVLAMTWWEGEADGKSGLDDMRSEDLLVAVIEVHEDEAGNKSDCPRYLACWSRRRYVY